jgi:hypothetical protein
VGRELCLYKATTMGSPGGIATSKPRDLRNDRGCRVACKKWAKIFREEFDLARWGRYRLCFSLSENFAAMAAQHTPKTNEE